MCSCEGATFEAFFSEHAARLQLPRPLYPPKTTVVRPKRRRRNCRSTQQRSERERGRARAGCALDESEGWPSLAETVREEEAETVREGGVPRELRATASFVSRLGVDWLSRRSLRVLFCECLWRAFRRPVLHLFVNCPKSKSDICLKRTLQRRKVRTCTRLFDQARVAGVLDTGARGADLRARCVAARESGQRRGLRRARARHAL